MNERMQRLLDVFRAAEQDVDASKRRRREASAVRLSELLVLQPVDRLKALKDPSLTAFDREQLERSVENVLPQRPSQFVRRYTPSLSSILRYGRFHRRKIIRLAVALAPFLWFGVAAVKAMPPAGCMPVVFKVPLQFRWTLLDGGFVDLTTYPAGTEAQWCPNSAAGSLRRWFPRAGYAVIEELPESLIANREIVRR